MSKVNKILAYVLFAIAGMLVVASLFKGAYLFYEAIAYGIIGVCLMDTSETGKKIEK